MTATDKRDRFRGCLVGLACGDALGAPVEGWARGAFPPVTTMTGGGTWNAAPGEWTDDTSMALCLATSLLDSGGFDARDQMEKYAAWKNDGFMSTRDKCFGIGMTCAQSIERFEKTGEPLSGPENPMTAGNGCIMRLAPVPMYFYPAAEQAVHYSGESSRTTHGARECIDACRLFSTMLFAALDGDSPEEILFGARVGSAREGEISEKIGLIAHGAYRHKKESEIKGSGYVVESLEAALWCFLHSDTYEEAVLKAVNLGHDTDTTAAICGQLAGAHYGESGIPAVWVERLVLRDEIGRLAELLMKIEQG